jgi:Fic family protein
LPADRSIDEALIKEVHRRIVTGCDDDHCEPGVLRRRDHNVTFGRPAHRGVEGGPECQEAFTSLCLALNQEFSGHDPFIRALALHYHMGAMHPFQDGNGRTARAVEALMLQRARLKDDLFVSMSNYYYDEKDKYLAVLADVREKNFDLTPFLIFGLNGIAIQCTRLLSEVKIHVEKSLFRDVMAQMYERLLSVRTRGLAERQMAILDFLLEQDNAIDEDRLIDGVWPHYQDLKAPDKAYARDISWLEQISAITVFLRNDIHYFSVRLEWSTEITETEFYRQLNKMPQARTKFVRRRS